MFKQIILFTGDLISLCSSFLEYLDNKKYLKAKVFLSLPLTLPQAKICWNKKKTLHPQIRIWPLWVLIMQKFTNIALAVLKIFYMVKSTNFQRTFDTKKPDVNRIKRKNGRAHPINFCGWPWPSKMLAKTHFTFENLLLYKSFLS